MGPLSTARLLLATMSSLWFTSIFAAPQEPDVISGDDEIILQTQGTQGATIHFIAHTQGTRWDEDGNLTSDFSSSDLYIYGDCLLCESPQGWDFVCSQDYGDPVVALGLYKIYDFGYTSAFFFLDLRDERMCYDNNDVFYKYDAELHTWKWRKPGEIYTQYRAINEGDTLRVWVQRDRGGATTSSFEPTDPAGLSISNSGGHPYLSWTGSEPSSALYHVYRSTSRTSGWGQRTTTALSVTHWTDDYVQLSGLTKFYYKVRALSGDENKWSTNYSNMDSCAGSYSEGKAAVTAEYGISRGDHSLTIGNYPNPFNPLTTLRFTLPAAGHVHLLVYDLMGREVARLVDGDLGAGEQEAVWKGENASGKSLPSGMYVYELQHGGKARHGRMLLVR